MPAKNFGSLILKDFHWLIRSVFRDIKNGNTRRVWIVGAGASVESGIDDASTLARRWSVELLGLSDADSLETIVKELKQQQIIHSTPEIDLGFLSKPGDHTRRLLDVLSKNYFEIYSERFPDEEAGYNELRKEMDGRLPSIGYMVLAQLLSTRSNLVITVNFDNLIAHALFLIDQALPLVLDHENVAHLASPLNQIPLICKIHRDVLKNPMSREHELSELNEKWEAPLGEVFKYYSPIFIGYGGNDHTLMTHLEKTERFIAPPIWLHYTSSVKNEQILEEVNPLIKQFLYRNNGILIPISGFDRLMLHANRELNLPDLLVSYDQRSSDVRCRLEYKILELAEVTGLRAASDPILGASLESAKRQIRRSISEWITVASSESDMQARISVYDDALSHQAHPSLYNNRGNAKRLLGRLEESLEDFNSSLNLDPKNGIAYFNRGNAFYDLGRFTDAVKDFDRAIELTPKHVASYCNRGNAKVELNLYSEAIFDYLIACSLSPRDADPLYNIACTYAIQGDGSQAVEWLKQACRIDPSCKDEAITDHDFDKICQNSAFLEFIGPTNP